MKLIDKVIAEIEERLHKYEQEYAELARYEIWGTARKIRPKIEELKNFRSFVASLETKEIDIENVAITEWNDYIKKIDGDPDYAYMLIKRDDYIALAKHFYELDIKS